jgi:hypothetical protein
LHSIARPHQADAIFPARMGGGILVRREVHQKKSDEWFPC